MGTFLHMIYVRARYRKMLEGSAAFGHFLIVSGAQHAEAYS